MFFSHPNYDEANQSRTTPLHYVWCKRALLAIVPHQCKIRSQTLSIDQVSRYDPSSISHKVA